MIIGEKRPITIDDKVLAKEVILEKTPNGKDSLKIFVKVSTPRGQEGST